MPFFRLFHTREIHLAIEAGNVSIAAMRTKFSVTPELSRDLPLALEAAERAAALLLARFRLNHTVTEKTGEKGIVADVDKEAETLILRHLQANSDYAILSEEAGAISARAEPCWVVDPLDGTTNFSRGIPLFAVSIALLIKNEIQLGVIADPLRDALYFSERERGAYCAPDVLLPCRERGVGSSLLFVNHGYAAEHKMRAAQVVSMFSTEFSIRECGTTTLELAYVAAGYAEAFLCSGDEIWDYAAGLRIAEEAGCRVTDWCGNACQSENEFILVARKEVHAELVSKVAPLQRKN